MAVTIFFSVLSVLSSSCAPSFLLMQVVVGCGFTDLVSRSSLSPVSNHFVTGSRRAPVLPVVRARLFTLLLQEYQANVASLCSQSFMVLCLQSCLLPLCQQASRQHLQDFCSPVSVESPWWNILWLFAHQSQYQLPACLPACLSSCLACLQGQIAAGPIPISTLSTTECKKNKNYR